MEVEESLSDESTRRSKLDWLANHLPSFPQSIDQPWVWSEEETAILRAACRVRFDESLRTESLFCIAAAAIRIFLDRTAKTPAFEQPVGMSDYHRGFNDGLKGASAHAEAQMKNNNLRGKCVSKVEFCARDPN